MTTTYDEMIESIVQSVFATMLNIDLVRCSEPFPSEHDLLLATVHIAGEWTGSVVLGLTPVVAQSAAATMLQIDPAEVTAVDRHDVASELVNMAGGNLKAVLPGPSFLSLPTVVSGTDFGLQVLDAELLDDVAFACESGLLHLRLFQKAVQPAAV